MAKKTKKSREEDELSNQPWFKRFFGGFVNAISSSPDFQALLFLGLSAIVGLSLFSYNPEDPSFSSTTFNWKNKATNICGYLGSFLSDSLYQLFGLCSWAFVLYFFWMFWSAFHDKALPKLEKTLFFFVGSLTICLSLGFFKNFYLYDGLIFSGGAVGKNVFKFLMPYISVGGIFIFIAISSLLTILVFLEKSLSELVYSLKSLFVKEKLYDENGEEIKDEVEPELTITRPGLVGLKEKFTLSKQVSDDSRYEPQEDDEQLSMIPVPQIKRPPKSKLIDTKMPKVSSKSEDDEWELPSLDMLGDVPEVFQSELKDEEIKNKAKLLVAKLEQFNVKGSVTGIKTGPAVTLFEFKPNVNVKISKITELADDLSLALACESVRIIAPIPGRDVVGIETSNTSRGTVYLKEILSTEDFWDEEEFKIPIGLGKQADGVPMVVDLRKMPHLLVAGSTGSGKSVFVVSTIISLLMRYSPDELRLVMVDPKQVDLAAFEDLPHLILPIIKEPKKAISSLRWAIREMDKRYRSMAKFGARNLEGYNETVNQLSEEELEECEAENESFEERKLINKSYYFEHLPYIVIIVEEFGDLMAVDKSNVEHAVVRLAQMARACGIHLILAMQSPRRDVVTGLIKTNIPGRISFKVASKTDSRIILDESGGERLLARGDMLFLSPGVSKPIRALGSWVPEDVIGNIVNFWTEQGDPEYLVDDLEDSGDDASGSVGGMGSSDDLDDRYDEVLEFVSTQKTISASLIQRRFRLGYPRAARLVEDMESQGVVGPAQGSKPRKVLIKSFDETSV